jgi:glycosyltransferase involved in cell wall biosynthesis
MHIGLNAHLLSSAAGYRTAGIHGYIDHLLRHLPQAAPPDWSFTAMVGTRSQHQIDGITLKRARWNTESAIARILWEQMIQPTQLGSFDLYHALAFVSPLLLSKPSVVTVYDLSFIHYPQVLSTARRLYLRLFTALSCQHARRVIAISHSTARDLHTSLGLPLAKIDVAPCGYDTERFKPLPQSEIEAFRAKNGLPERFWLFIGTLEPRKNLHTLLRAYAALPEHERLPLILAGGKGWLYDDIFRTVEQHQLGDWVKFPGFVSAESLPFWYNSAEVFLYPSVFEGFGLPVLEAMACGTPVIISDASSLPEVAGKAGMCIPPTDIHAWTAALHQASTDKQWREQARILGLREASRFQWQATAAQTIKSYQLALASNGS